MSTPQIQIQPNPYPSPTQPGKFNPKDVQANAGDNLTWFNGDTQAHWPTPDPANKSAWFSKQIEPGEPSGSQVALGANEVIVASATNANPVVFSVRGPAPATGTQVKLTFAGPDESKWEDAIGDLDLPVPATNQGPSVCSIPMDSTALGPLDGQITILLPGSYTINYVCALHKDEKGSITVNPQQ